MSTHVKGESSDSLNFDAAEAVSGTTAARTCTKCQAEISQAYHEANGQVVCTACRAKLEETMRGGGSGGARFGRALLLGAIAAATGAGIWYAVAALTNASWGIIAIVVGWLVGRGVAIGSGGRGGWRYQALAIVLTYVAIVSTYIPMAVKEGVDAPLIALFIVALALPFLAGIQNIIGIAIIAFALYQAWSINKRMAITFTGPYRVKPVSTSPALRA